MVEGKKSGAESLTAEQQMMLRLRYRDKTKALSAEDKRAFNKKLRAEMDAMSEADLARTKAVLQGQWDKLPEDRKKRMADRIAQGPQKAGRGENAGQE